MLYATSYVATRLVLNDVPPAMLALLRLLLGGVALALVVRGRARRAVTSADRWRIAGMGVLGTAVAFALSHWGLALSTATSAALLIVVEPIAIVLASPMILGERLGRREVAGAALALTGTVVVVLDGIPGVVGTVLPHWRGDVLLVLAGVAYAAYTLLGREVLIRHDPVRVTLAAIAWGAVAIAPLTAAEWWAGLRPVWTARGIAGAAYLGVVITGLCYLLWNWALARVAAPRAAIFLNVQPVVGALLGVMLLGDRLTAFTLAGGALVVAGLTLTVKGRP